MPPRIVSGDLVSLVSVRAEGQALAVPPKVDRQVSLAEVGAVATRLVIWRTGFRYEQQKVVGFGTAAFEAGPVYFGACVSFLTLSGQFLSSVNDNQPLRVMYKNDAPRDTEAFILLDEHGAPSERPVEYGDVVILKRANGRYLHCTQTMLPAFRSEVCSENEKFRIWF